MHNNLHTQIIAHNSAAYWAAVALRDKVLRQPLGLQYSPEQLAAESNQHHFATYTQTGDLVGCLILQETNKKKYLKMRQVAVDANYQRQGIGNKMVLDAEQWAVQNGFTHIECHARDLAVPFYLQLTYQTIGEPFIEVGITHYLMEKDLRFLEHTGF